MSISDRFLSEAKIGAFVTVMVGSKEINGVIISLDISTVQIRKNDGNTPTLSIENISYYEFNSNSSAQLLTDAHSSFVNTANRTELVFSKLQERGDFFFVDVCEPSIKAYSDIAFNSKSEMKDKLKAISDSIDYAINQSHENNPGDYKLHENIRKLKKIIKTSGNQSRKDAANMLGALYYKLQNDRLALEAYIDGDDYVSAFLIAREINSSDDMEMFACCHLVQSQLYDPYVIKWLTSYMIEKDDYSILKRIVPNALNNTTLSGTMSVVKAILLANNVNYDNSFDKGKSVSMLDSLLRQINSYGLSKQSELQKNIDKKIAKQSPQMDISSTVKGITKRASFTKSANYKTNSVKETKRVNSNYPSYYQIAQNAELNEKDLQKAIVFYEKAIENGERLSGSIPSLVSLFIRLEMYDDALKLLDDSGAKHMEITKYLNLRISVFKAAKNPMHKKEIKNTYIELVSYAATSDKKTEIFLDEASTLIFIGEYEEAKTILDNTLNVLERSRCYENSSEIKEKRLVTLYGNYCNLFIRLNDYESAQKYASKLLEIIPENKFAQSIIQGHGIEDLHNISDTLGVSDISDYIAKRIDLIVLENELKNTGSIKDGVFIGTVDEASRIIGYIIGQQVRIGVNDELISNYYFAIAKLIRQILDRDEDIDSSDVINERMYQLYVAIGCYFYGNYRLNSPEITSSFDSARFCLFESFSMFQNSEKTHKCWAASTIRYLQSFYCSPAEIREKEADPKIFYSLKNYDKEYESRIKNIMSTGLQSSSQEFVVGMIEMLAYNYRIKDLILSNIQSNHSLYNDVLNVLKGILSETVENINTFDEFKDLWNKASRKYDLKRKSFIRLIGETIDSSFVIGELHDNRDKLISSDYSSLLSALDKDYYRELISIFEALLRYNEIPEFDYKADTLSKANEIRNRLEERINDNPTYFGYQKLLPLLTQLQAKIIKESSQLYGNSAPEISIEVAGDCSINSDNTVMAPIAFTNKNNVQNADNVSIKIEGDKVRVVNDEQLSRILLNGNGKSLEEMVEFKVEPELLKEQVFAVTVSIQYQYKTSMTETQLVEMDVPLSIPLYSDSTFKPVENKYEPYRNGNQVKEPSMFYGRDKEIQSIIGQICDARGNVLRGRCLALYGQTRTGKSSLLYHIERKLREIDEERNVIINIGSIGEENLSGNDITEFLYTILDELNHEINHKHPVLKETCNDAGFTINASRLIDNPNRSQMYFNDVFRNLNRLIEDNGLNYNIIIMIDEFTYIYDWIRMGTMTDQIMKFWKAFIQNNGVFAIIIGQDHMMKFVEEKQFTNDFGSTDLRKVTYLPEEDAKRLMYEPILLIGENGEKINRYKEGALERLYELTAGSAFLIMNLCAGLVDYLNKTHSVYITRAHVDDYLKKNLGTFEEARYFEPQYDDKSNVNSDETNAENKRILHKIAQLSNKKEWTSLSNVISDERDRELIKSLEQRDVIIVANNERCKIKVGLYKEWIIEKYGVEGQK